MSIGWPTDRQPDDSGDVHLRDLKIWTTPSRPGKVNGYAKSEIRTAVVLFKVVSRSNHRPTSV